MDSNHDLECGQITSYSTIGPSGRPWIESFKAIEFYHHHSVVLESQSRKEQKIKLLRHGLEP